MAEDLEKKKTQKINTEALQRTVDLITKKKLIDAKNQICKLQDGPTIKQAVTILKKRGLFEIIKQIAFNFWDRKEYNIVEQAIVAYNQDTMMIGNEEGGNKWFYIGEIKNGKRQGDGEWRSIDGSSYEGQWHEDQRNGQATSKDQTGTYEGNFLNNKRHGQGKYFY